MDKNKTPTAGWAERGIKEHKAPYSSQNSSVINSQLQSMKEVGVDFVIVDMSNGWPDKPKISERGNISVPYRGKNAEFHGDQSSTNALKKFRNEIKITEGPKYCFMIGLEFQGPERFFEKKKQWDHSWQEQYLRIDELVTRIRRIIKEDKEQYYYHLGKPLLLVYLNKGYDYPPRDYSRDNRTIRKWDYLIKDFDGCWNSWPGSTRSIRC